MSSGRECSSDLVGIPTTDAGMIDGKSFEMLGCAKVVRHAGVCCCSTDIDEFCLLEYSECNKKNYLV